MLLIIMLATVLSGQVKTQKKFTLEQGIRRLMPSVKEKIVKMVSQVIRTKAHKYGLKKEDWPVILGMIMTESSFRHTMGTHGEVGMLQIIPSEGHIKRIVAKNIRCNKKEKYCKKNGRPDIYVHGGRLVSFKVKRFLKAHPHYALETGFGEMVYWKGRYNGWIKRKLWRYYPHNYFKKKYGRKYLDKKDDVKKRWYRNRRKAKGLKWVTHYNQGARIVISKVAMGYPMRVLQHYNISLGRSRYEAFRPYKTPIKVASTDTGATMERVSMEKAK